MYKDRYRKLLAAVLICGLGVACQLLPSGCAEYYTQSVLSSFNFCSVFNCEGGTFFNFCEPVALFADCPNVNTTGQ